MTFNAFVPPCRNMPMRLATPSAAKMGAPTTINTTKARRINVKISVGSNQIYLSATGLFKGLALNLVSAINARSAAPIGMKPYGIHRGTLSREGDLYAFSMEVKTTLHQAQTSTTDHNRNVARKEEHTSE